jgi:hypothetical protein
MILILKYMGLHANDSAQAGVGYGELYDLKKTSRSRWR